MRVFICLQRSKRKPQKVKTQREEHVRLLCALCFAIIAFIDFCPIHPHSISDWLVMAEIGTIFSTHLHPLLIVHWRVEVDILNFVVVAVG